MEYRYTKRESDIGVIYFPSLPVYLNGFSVGHALVDTGADITILPSEINQVLNVELDHSGAIDLGSAGGGVFRAIPSKEKIEYSLGQSGFRPISWKVIVFFAPRQPQILLGQYQCLDQLILTLDAKKRALTVKI